MPAATFPDLDGNVPIALLPVRIETNFRNGGPTGKQLFVRVFPDTIHSDTFEEQLTSDEADWRLRFWQQTWRAGKATTGQEAEARTRIELAAWRELAGRYGPARALYIATAKKLVPTNPDDRPEAANPDQAVPLAREPRFGDPGPAREASWSRAAIASCLPDRWLVVAEGKHGNLSKWAEFPVAPNLAIGPRPRGPGEAATSDPGLAWLQSFPAAEAAGMALRIDVSSEQASEGFERLVVVGVKSEGVDKYAGSQALARLLASHRATWGLSFVRQGTPTSNTQSEVAGESSHDPGFEASFGALRQHFSGQPQNDDMDGAMFAKALGLDREQFAAVDGAREVEHSASAHINRALWPVTFGYFAEQMLDGVLSDFDPNTWTDYFGRHQAWADHFCRHVWGRGPLPAVRIGRQPFGVLPVTSIDEWKASAFASPRFSALLTGLRDNIAKDKPAPHAGRDSSKTGQDLVDVLGQGAVATSFSVRRLRGPEFMQMFWLLPTKEVKPDDINAAFGKLGAGVDGQVALAGLGPARNERLSRSVLATAAEPFKGPIVREGDLSEAPPLPDDGDNYMARLINPAFTLLDIHDETPAFWPAGKPKPLLYRLLRQALLLAYARQALKDYPDTLWNQGFRSAPFFEPELVDIWPYWWDNREAPPAPTRTLWRILRLKLPTGLEVGSTLRAMGMNPPEPLRSFLDSLSRLASLPTAALGRLFTESIGLASHRLDAWATSVASKLLSDCRAADAKALYVGAYGWVENVPPSRAPRSDGFVHAPSLAQASTAAVLMSARLANGDQAPGARMELDLSSSRVRLALELVDGVRQGQALGALIGYRIERSLHDAGLHAAVAALRQRAPIAGGEVIPRDASDPVESVATNNVVDGRQLVTQYARDNTSFDDVVAAGPDRTALARILSTAQDALKAVGDLCLAEAAHQATQGNYARAAAALNAVSRADAFPEFEVIRTPVSGVTITQRVLLLFATPTSASPDGWDDSRARALANPTLNAWAGQLFGPGTDIQFQARYYGPDQTPDLGNPTPLKTENIALSALSLCPLDIVFAPPLAESPGQSDLEWSMMRHAMSAKPAGAETATQVRLGWPRGDGQGIRLGLLELFELARALRDIITAGRAASARDLARAGQDVAAGFMDNALDANLARVDDAWKAAKTALDEARTRPGVTGSSPTAGALNALAEKLDACTAFALQGAAPTILAFEPTDAPSRSQRDSLAAQADSVLRQMEAAEVVANDSGRSKEVRLKAYVGENFPLARYFAPDAASKWREGLLRRKTKGDAGKEVLEPWIERLSNVRPELFKLNLLHLYARTMKSRAAGLGLCAAQMPFDDTDEWNQPVGPANTGATCIVAATPGLADDLSTASQLWGLVIDEWNETVPRAKLMSGVAFQYDPADTPRSPQSMLIACAPDPTRKWNETALVKAVTETLGWARLRMVDYDGIANFGHLLPAIHLAHSIGGEPGGDTVSAQLL